MACSPATRSGRRLWRLAIVPGIAMIAVGATFAFSSSNGATNAGTHTVEIQGFAFHPATITVAPGTKVKVTNRDATTHTLTAMGGTFETGPLNGGASALITAPLSPGTYAYHCNIHPFMHGVLQVAR
jgi:plastocyanin